MKEKIMDGLQKFSKAMFIPVLILPIAGILIAVVAGTPVGSTIVAVDLGVFALFALLGALTGRTD